MVTTSNKTKKTTFVLPPPPTHPKEDGTTSWPSDEDDDDATVLLENSKARPKEEVADLWDTVQTELTNMGRALTCPLCLCTYRKAVILPCVHAYCESCLIKALRGKARCPTCFHKATKRSMVASPLLTRLAQAYKLALRDFGFAPIQYDPSYTAMTQIATAEQQESSSPSKYLVDCHQHLQVSRTWQKVLQWQKEQRTTTTTHDQDKVKKLQNSIYWHEQQQQKIIAVNERALIQAAKKRSGANITDDSTTTEHPWRHDQQVDEDDNPSMVKSQETLLSRDDDSMAQEFARDQAMANRSSEWLQEEQSKESQQTAVFQDAVQELPPGGNAAHEDSQVYLTPSEPPQQEDFIWEEGKDDDSSCAGALVMHNSHSATTTTHDETTMKDLCLDSKSPTKVVKAKEKPLQDDATRIASSKQPKNSPTTKTNDLVKQPPDTNNLFSVGTIVHVQSRTWPGMNKPGGIARITKVHPEAENISYNVNYVLGGREKNVPAVFLCLPDDEDGKRIKKVQTSSFPMISIDQLTQKISSQKEPTTEQETTNSPTCQNAKRTDLKPRERCTTTIVKQPCDQVNTITVVEDKPTTAKSTSTDSGGKKNPTKGGDSNCQKNTKETNHDEKIIPIKLECGERNLPASLSVGTIVHVTSRTWPGMNKPGGVARITKVYSWEDDSSSTTTYDVSYVLGGKEKKVNAMFVSPHYDLTQQDNSTTMDHPIPMQDKRTTNERKSRRISDQSQRKCDSVCEIPSELLAELTADGFDTTGLLPILAPKKAAGPKKRKRKSASSIQTKLAKKVRPSPISQQENLTLKANKATICKNTRKGFIPLPKKRKGLSESAQVQSPAAEKPPTTLLTSTSSKTTTTTLEPQKKKAGFVLPRSRITNPPRLLTKEKASMVRAVVPKQQTGRTTGCGSSNSPAEICRQADMWYSQKFQKFLSRRRSSGTVIRVVASSLSKEDTIALQELCRRSKGTAVQVTLCGKFNPSNTTLCLLPEETQQRANAANKNNCEMLASRYRTMKAMRAALAGIPLVSPRWIATCKHQVVEPTATMFLRSLPTKAKSKDSTWDIGVARMAAKLSKGESTALLSHCLVYFCGSFEKTPKSDLQVLLEECGATVSSRVLLLPGILATLRQPALAPKGKTIVFLFDEKTNSNKSSSNTNEEHSTLVSMEGQLKLSRRSTSIVIVSVQWIFDSISFGHPIANTTGYKPASWPLLKN